MPLLDYETKPLTQSEVKIETHRGTGCGGQNQNKTDSAVRARHIPTGFVVSINGRDQLQNKKKALQILTAKVNKFHQDKAKEKHDKNKSLQIGDRGRSDKIRTYNLSNNLVVDHRTGVKSRNLKQILKGRLELLY